MKTSQHNDYFRFYSDKWERAIKEKRYDEALIHAIRGYLVSRDMEEESFQIACLAYMAKAIEALSNKSSKQQRDLDKKVHRCSFCGRRESEVRLIAGAGANICEICASKIYQIFRKGTKGKKTDEPSKT